MEKQSGCDTQLQTLICHSAQWNALLKSTKKVNFFLYSYLQLITDWVSPLKEKKKTEQTITTDERWVKEKLSKHNISIVLYNWTYFLIATNKVSFLCSYKALMFSSSNPSFIQDYVSRSIFHKYEVDYNIICICFWVINIIFMTYTPSYKIQNYRIPVNNQ